MFNLSDKISRNILINCDHGTMIVNRFDCNEKGVGHGQWLLDHGNASTVEAATCFKEISNLKEPVVFDVGANIGTFATWISRAFPKGKIYAFEPQREVFQILCGNAAINNLYNIYAYNLALGNINSSIEIETPDYFKKNDFGTFSLVEKVIKEVSNKELITITQLDEFVNQYRIDRLDLLKIDVEGMDLDVLLGAKSTIKKLKPIIFIEHCDYRKTILPDIKNFLLSFNYCFEIFNNNVLCKPINQENI